MRFYIFLYFWSFTAFKPIRGSKPTFDRFALCLQETFHSKKSIRSEVICTNVKKKKGIESSGKAWYVHLYTYIVWLQFRANRFNWIRLSWRSSYVFSICARVYILFRCPHRPHFTYRCVCTIEQCAYVCLFVYERQRDNSILSTFIHSKAKKMNIFFVRFQIGLPFDFSKRRREVS